MKSHMVLKMHVYLRYCFMNKPFLKPQLCKRLRHRGVWGIVPGCWQGGLKQILFSLVLELKPDSVIVVTRTHPHFLHVLSLTVKWCF